MHSLFGVSKAAADLMVQEYGRYFGMPTVCFRGGCLTGPNHAGAQLHGFLAYLMRCTVTGEPYTIFGYDGQAGPRQHPQRGPGRARSREFHKAPRSGGRLQPRRRPRRKLLDARGDRAVRGDLRQASCGWELSDEARVGDHAWWISDLRQFQARLPRLVAVIWSRRDPARDLRIERRALGGRRR